MSSFSHEKSKYSVTQQMTKDRNDPNFSNDLSLERVLSSENVTNKVDYSFSRIPLSAKPVPTKFTINSPGDKYEQEADAMADKVMQTPGRDIPQRKCVKCEHEKEKLQRKSLVQINTPVASPQLNNRIQSSRGNGESMDNNTRSFMSNRFGVDFSMVRVHTNNDAALMNDQLHSKAFTFGNDIYFNRGMYDPKSESGKYLLAHELTHTIHQQSATNDASGFFIQRSIDDVNTALKEPFPDEENDPTGERIQRIRRNLKSSFRQLTPDEANLLTWILLELPGELTTKKFQMLHRFTRFELLKILFGMLTHTNAEAVHNIISSEYKKRFELLAREPEYREELIEILSAKFKAAHQLPANRRIWVNLKDENFKNSGSLDPDNKCQACDSLGALGTLASRGQNVMELRGDIAGPTEKVDFDFKRKMEKGTWKKIGHRWERIDYEPAGTPDDSYDNDEDLSKKNNHIYVVDRPGPIDINEPFLPKDDKATGYIYIASFVEWVEAKQGSGAWVVVSDEFEWHSVTTLEKINGRWRKTGTNEIAPGPYPVAPPF